MKKMKLSPSYQASIPRMVMVPLGWSKKVLTRLLRSSRGLLLQAQAHSSTYLTTYWRPAWRLLRTWRLKKLFKSEACFILRQGFTVWFGPGWPGIPAFPILPGWPSFSLAMSSPPALMVAVFPSCLAFPLLTPTLSGQGACLLGKHRPAHNGKSLEINQLACYHFHLWQSVSPKRKEMCLEFESLCMSASLLGDSECPSLLFSYLMSETSGVVAKVGAHLTFWQWAWGILLYPDEIYVWRHRTYLICMLGIWTQVLIRV